MEKIRLGVFGTRRGMDFRRDFIALGCEFVALCDNRPHVLEDANKQLGGNVAMYDKFEDFIEHDMDAVIIANNFHEHVPFVIECFKRNLHVFCECMAAGTMAESVELVRAFEKSNSIYFLAENYPQMPVNLEMARIVKEGTLGKILYAEGEYNHPGSAYDVEYFKKHNYNLEHWRNYIPKTYYITHSLGPLINATGAMPKNVYALAANEPFPTDEPHPERTCDRGAIMMTQNDDGSVYRFVGCSEFGAHHNSVRFCGTKGAVENIRGTSDKILLRYNDWEIPDGMKENQEYTVDISNDKDYKFIKNSYHAGGDFITARLFTECVRAGKQPPAPFDVYSATSMASVAILAWRSVLNGKPYEIPDFHKEDDRVKWQDDRLTPFPGEDGTAPTLPCCSNPDFKLSEENVSKYLEIIK